MKTVAVTGATGLIGAHVCAHFAERGWTVRALVREPDRRPCAVPGATSHRCELPDELDETALAGAEAVVHCAYATRARDLEQARRVNEDGTLRLLRAARAAEVPRFVFLSSIAARRDSPAYYGRSKFELEQQLDPTRGDVALRPGLVLASAGGGLFGRLCDTLRSTRFVPVFGGGRQPFQTVHVADLCTVIERVLERNLTGTYVAAEDEPVPYRELLREIAARLGRPVHLIPVPFGPALLALRLLERLPLPLPVSTENLRGLRAMEHVPAAADQARLGLGLRSWRTSLDEILGRAPSPSHARDGN